MMIAAAVIVGVLAATHAVDAPALQDVLSRATAYVERFERLLNAIVADEHYVQQMGIVGRRGEFIVTTRKELTADLLLVREAGGGYREVRSVFEVDGKLVRDPVERHSHLRDRIGPVTETEKMRIRGENAVFNIGDIVRTINTPLMALQVLSRSNRQGFRFARAKETAADVGDPGESIPGVFRVATEVWVVEFNERQRGTLIRTTGGRDVPCHGRLWIEPETGRILMSEIIAESREVRAQMTVSFKSEPLLELLVPVEMRESYRAKNRSATRIEAAASYGKFSVFSVK